MASAFIAAITPAALNQPQTVVKELVMSLFTAQTGTGSAPTDAVPPPTQFGTVGNGSTADPGGWTPILGAIRTDGFKQVSLSLEVYGSSGSVTATFQPYFFDGTRWVACADSITLTNSQTTSNPAARQRHDIVVENDFGFIIVLSAISGSGATAAAYATLRDKILAQK